MEDGRTVTVSESGEGGFAQQITSGAHTLRSDEPEAMGGTDTGPTPYDLLLAGLGACTSMTVRMYADRKGWPLSKVAVTLRHSHIHAEDCRTCETRAGRLDHIEREISLEGDLDEDQRTKLMEIAVKCPVHRTLRSETLIETLPAPR